MQADHVVPEGRLDDFFAELSTLTETITDDRQPEDLAQIRKFDVWGRGLSLAGYATACLGVNPISPVLMAIAMSIRWMIFGHHVMHGGYDRYPDVPARYTSKAFAKGWRRWLDWCDWVIPQPWAKEHNGMHHFRLGESKDPDLPEDNAKCMVDSALPAPLKWFLLALNMVTWKWSYYAPNTVCVVSAKGRAKEVPYNPLKREHWDPRTASGRKVWLQSWLPYPLIRFGLMPLPFLAMGRTVYVAVLVNSLIADLLSNLHTWLVIVPNHAGRDVVRFDHPAATHNEYLLRQIVGSVNYTTGGDLRDFLFGGTNYQIEHHVWMSLSMGQYQRVQPKLKALCARYGVPYIQEPIQTRVYKTIENIMGFKPMQRVNYLPAGSERLQDTGL